MTWHLCTELLNFLFSLIFYLNIEIKKDDLICHVCLFQDHPSVLRYLRFSQFHFKSAISLEDYFTAY